MLKGKMRSNFFPTESYTELSSVLAFKTQHPCAQALPYVHHLGQPVPPASPFPELLSLFLSLPNSQLPLCF